MPNAPQNFSLSGFIKLTRIGNLLIIAFAQYFTAVFLANPVQQWKITITDHDLFLVSLSSVLIAAAGYIINDYYDVKIDFINKPDRVVVGKIIKRRVVMVSHTFINFVGIAIGLLVSPLIAAINFISAGLLWLYSNQLKRLPLVGNVSVALLTGLAIYVVEVLYESGNFLIVVYAIFALGYTLIREVVKDMEDVKGDEAFECRTIPVVYGIRKTKMFLNALMVMLALGISIILHQINTAFADMLLVGNVSMLLVLAVFLYQADTKRQFHQLSTITKVMMLMGVLSMVLI